jgi:outer membrane protein assembly factor BamA
VSDASSSDRWRVVPIAAYFDLFRQFRGVGGDRTSTQFDYRQVGAIAIVQVLREVGFKHFYAGLLGGYTTFRTSTGNPANQEVLTNLGTGPDWSGQPNLGVVAQYDTKDDQYYPTAGLDGNVRLNGSFKSDQKYLLLVPSLNQYFSLIGGDRVVLAYRLFGQFGFGDLPLASYAYYGSRGTTLGYASGDYVDKMMAGAEVEARWLFSRRVGAEAGTGIGKVFPSFDEFGPQPWLPAVWASLTYQVMESKQMRARLTFALGKSGGALYAAVGQNF